MFYMLDMILEVCSSEAHFVHFSPKQARKCCAFSNSNSVHSVSQIGPPCCQLLPSPCDAMCSADGTCHLPPPQSMDGHAASHKCGGNLEFCEWRAWLFLKTKQASFSLQGEKSTKAKQKLGCTITRE